MVKAETKVEVVDPGGPKNHVFGLYFITRE